jgi:hypothetical protein
MSMGSAVIGQVRWPSEIMWLGNKPSGWQAIVDPVAFVRMELRLVNVDRRLIRDNARDAFEAHHLCNNKKLAARNEHGDYVSPSIQDAWSGWDACWSMLKEACK